MKIFSKNLLTSLLVLHLAVFNLGCTAFIVGSAVGALGGYAISRDTIQGEVDKDYDSLWESAADVLDMMDASEINDSTKGRIQARITKTKVLITIEQLTPHTSRLKVKCRKGIFPKLALSQNLYVKIIEQAK